MLPPKLSVFRMASSFLQKAAKYSTKFATKKSNIQTNYDFGLKLRDVKIGTSDDYERFLKFTREHHLKWEPQYQALGKLPDFDPEHDGIANLVKKKVDNGLTFYAEQDGEVVALSLNSVKSRGDLFAYNPEFQYLPCLHNYHVLKELTYQKLFTNPEFSHVNKILLTYYGCIHDRLKGKSLAVKFLALLMGKNLSLLENENVDGFVTLCTAYQTYKVYKDMGGVCAGQTPDEFLHMYPHTPMDKVDPKLGMPRLMFLPTDVLKRHLKEMNYVEE